MALLIMCMNAAQQGTAIALGWVAACLRQAHPRRPHSKLRLLRIRSSLPGRLLKPGQGGRCSRWQRVTQHLHRRMLAGTRLGLCRRQWQGQGGHAGAASGLLGRGCWGWRCQGQLLRLQANLLARRGLQAAGAGRCSLLHGLLCC